MTDPGPRELRRWLDENLSGDWLRHRLGLACLRPETGHEFVPCPRRFWRSWGGDPECMFIRANRWASRCLKPGRCHAPG